MGKNTQRCIITITSFSRHLEVYIAGIHYHAASLAYSIYIFKIQLS